MKSIETATQILNEDFDISLHTDSLKLYSQAEWNDFCSSENITGRSGVFYPRDMTAHVLDDGSEQNIIHEHLAHRAFFECTESGQHIAKKDKELELLEDMICGSHLSRLTFVEDQSVKSHTVAPDGTVRYNPSDTLVKVYLQSAESLLRASSEPDIESFADWLTDYLCSKLGLSHDTHISSFHKEEDMTGPISALYIAGCKRSRRDDIMLNLLQEHLKDRFDDTILIINYGSDKPFSDMDFLAVQKDSAKSTSGLSLPDYLDVSFAGQSQLMDALRLMDPQYCEPILSGRKILGDEGLYSALKSQCQSGCTSEEFIGYMNGRYKEAMSFAKQCHSIYNARRDVRNLYRAVINLSYAGMYALQIETFPESMYSAKDQEYFNALLSDNPGSVFSSARKLAKNVNMHNYPSVEKEFILLYRKLAK